MAILFFGIGSVVLIGLRCPFWNVTRVGTVRAATIEEIEAEKAAIEKDVVSLSQIKIAFGLNHYVQYSLDSN